MQRIQALTVSVLLVLGAAGCRGSDAAPADEPSVQGNEEAGTGLGGSNSFEVGITAEDSPLVINEFMPSNASTITDEGGGTGDWLEIYNRSDEAIDLEGYFISDNPDLLAKAELGPGLIVEPGGFLLLWADSDIDQGPDHLPFNLARAGEEVLLISPMGEVLDSVAFQGAAPDVSFARFPDGTGDFAVCHSPSPEAPNDEACAR